MGRDDVLHDVVHCNCNGLQPTTVRRYKGEVKRRHLAPIQDISALVPHILIGRVRVSPAPHHVSASYDIASIQPLAARVRLHVSF